MDGGGVDCTFAPPLHQNQADGAKQIEGQNARSFYNGIEREERRTESSVILHNLPVTQSNQNQSVSLNVSVCDPEDGAKQNQIRSARAQFNKSGYYHQNSWCKIKCKDGINVANVQDGKVKGMVLPLPGLLDHRDFVRVNKELGKCSLCGEGEAIFSSKEMRMSICEGGYGRLLREECLKEGVR